MLVTYGTGSNPVTPRGWISRKRRERNDGKKKEKNSETMESVFVLYGNIYLIMNDDNNNKKRLIWI